jgi:uncharacterized protein
VTLPYRVLGLKADLAEAKGNLDILRELHPDVEIIPVSVYSELSALRETIYRMLDVIRVYGKSPGKKAELERPFILKSGSTVVDFAYEVHRDFPARLKSALVWGSARFDGQAVPREYVLHDKDVVELNV